MPPSANLALRELGIVLFLAVVGLKSGGNFIDTLLHGDGLAWVGYGALITSIPLISVGILARVVGKMNYLTLSGMLAGSMTDPPALAFANGLHPDQRRCGALLCHGLPAGNVPAHHVTAAAGGAVLGDVASKRGSACGAPIYC